MADPNFKNRRTPGVYVSELSAFPPSAVGVETAVPVFIGYTEKAEIGGVSAFNVPVRIASHMEFDQYFGGGPTPSFALKDVSVEPVSADKATAAQAAATAALAAAEAARLAAAALQQTATAQQEAAQAAGTAAPADKAARDKAAKDAEATAKAAADDYKTKSVDFASSSRAAIAAADEAWPISPSARFDISYRGDADNPFKMVYKQLVGSDDGPKGCLHTSLQLFYANGGGPCYIVSVGGYKSAVDPRDLMAGLEAVKDTEGPTMLVIPDASLLEEGDYRDLARAMMAQARTKQDRVALLDVRQARDLPLKPGTKELGDSITAFREGMGTENLSYGMAYFPYLNTSVVRPADLDYTAFDAGQLANYLLADWARAYPPGPGAQKDFIDCRTNIAKGWPKDAQQAEALKGKFEAVIQDLAAMGQSGADNVKRLVEAVAAEPVSKRTPAAVKARNQDLLHVFPGMSTLYEQAARVLNLLPASAAMAGVMATTDSTRGVWNAPANIALNAVNGVAVRVNDEVQADLNKPLDGKAINVIREFVGRGPIVWGARTLDGNSNDYRYVQVRRTLIYMEQSIKAAMNPFVFAPNDGKTWVSVVAMVSSFLESLWSRGGLMGATPQEAFSVNCGLGSTMSAQDILEGYMVVQVLVQMIHPAEFIELTFKQKMESAG